MVIGDIARMHGWPKFRRPLMWLCRPQLLTFKGSDETWGDRAWGRSHLIPMQCSFGHKSLHCTSPTAQYRHIFIFADEAHWASLGCLWYTTFSKHLPFIADESCLVGVPDGINGGGGAGGLFVLASVCCFIACRCWIFNISGFSIMALAKFVLLLLMLMP